MMSKINTTLWMLFACIAVSSAQLKITEISYNPPESGTDSLEYIELYNAGSTALDLENYSFSKGVVMTFPAVTIQAGGYLVVAVNAEAMDRNFNVTAIQWTKDALSNSGETISIVDPNGNEVISVTYQKTAPWPTFADGTDGGGRSIELCNIDADPNDGSNWKVSENDYGFQINGRQVYGTPGAENSVHCGVTADYIIEVSESGFSPKDLTIQVGESVRWVNISGSNNINGDQTVFGNNPESFGNGSPASGDWTYDYKFEIAGYYEYQSDPSGIKGSITVEKKPVIDAYPYRTIAEVKGVKADGVADSLGIKCTLVGIVHSINYRPTGLQFVINDAQNKGFAIFNNSNNFGYDVTPGDEVEVKGKIDQFRGLSQLVVDSLKVRSSGNALVDVKKVDEFVEDDESSFIQISDVAFADPTQWEAASSGFNVEMVKGSQTYAVRIVNTSDAFNAPIPAGERFNVIGILSQFAGSSAPFEGGYQLQPRYLVDFEALSSVADLDNSIQVTIAPNPVTNQITVISEQMPQKIEIMDAQGNQVKTLSNKDTIDFSMMPSGMYLIKIEIGNQTLIKKV
ncbi:MAG: lamin tail domain-containing protein, partial [Chitinophagales bacterium]|nr:lamin tail domain-containing protein [Chitinophagales bacterium]